MFKYLLQCNCVFEKKAKLMKTFTVTEIEKCDLSGVDTQHYTKILNNLLEGTMLGDLVKKYGKSYEMGHTDMVAKNGKSEIRETGPLAWFDHLKVGDEIKVYIGKFGIIEGIVAYEFNNFLEISSGKLNFEEAKYILSSLPNITDFSLKQLQKNIFLNNFLKERGFDSNFSAKKYVMKHLTFERWRFNLSVVKSLIRNGILPTLSAPRNLALHKNAFMR